jgi:uncharacterized membrane protein YhaH (DUF805 family)
MDWYVAAMRNYAGFSGRASRREYGWTVGMMLLLSLVLGAVAGIAGPEFADVTGALVTLVHLVPGLAVGARRLHDSGRSGWWQLLWFVPVVGVLAMLVLLLWPGTSRDNRYGPPAPVQPADD